MFYAANIITVSVFLELLWKFIILICYKLNIFGPPLVNQFDIRAILFGGYARFVPWYFVEMTSCILSEPCLVNIFNYICGFTLASVILHELYHFTKRFNIVFEPLLVKVVIIIMMSRWPQSFCVNSIILRIDLTRFYMKYK